LTTATARRSPHAHGDLAMELTKPAKFAQSAETFVSAPGRTSRVPCLSIALARLKPDERTAL
jgi:hypothetical protein